METRGRGSALPDRTRRPGAEAPRARGLPRDDLGVDGELIAAILEGTPDATIVVDDAGSIWYANRRVADVFGWDPDELLGQHMRLLIPERLREVHAEHRAAYMRDPRPRPMSAGLLHGLHRDGHEIPVDISLSPIDAPGGRLVAASVRDATERLRAEEVVRAERDHVAALIDSFGDGVLEAEVSGWRYLHANKAFCEMVGMTSAEVLALDARDPAPWAPEHQREAAADLVRRVLRGDTAHGRLVMRHRDGTEFPAMVTMSLVRIDSGPLRIVADVRDASEDEWIAAELAEARAAVRVADERDRIARDLHDRVIQGLFAAGLHLEAAACRVTDPMPLLSVVDEIDAAITEIRSSIFTLHRPRGVQTGLESVLRTCADEASRLLGHRPAVTLRGAWQLVDQQLTDEAGAVVRELLSNVARHADADHTWLTAEIEGGCLRLRVEDDGVGIAAGTGGGGDGLRNVAERARQRHGDAMVERREPAGTIVTWTVPFATGDAVSSPEPPNAD